ncbi:MAG: TonB-dependent receptor, partial [Candidatus Omnitrophota bacterium]
TDAVTLLGGFNYLRERAESYRFSDDRWGPSESVFPKRFADSKGYFVEARVVWFEELVTTGSFRIEDHSNFGTQDTWKVDAVYHAGPWGTKLRSAYGTGFKAPSLYQLYAPADPWFGGGNASLKPETSSSYEFGVEQPLWKDSLTTGLTYFNSHFANLIDAQYHPDTWLTDPYANIGKARSFGFELPLTYTYSDRLRVKGSYTWTDTENLDNHRELLRRAKNKIGLNIDCYPADKIKLRWDTVYYGSRYDSGYQKLKGYSKTDFNIAYQATPQMEIYVRFENLFAAKYEEAKNYGTPGFGVFGGVKLKY